MNYLVTGGTGFLGMSLVNILLEDPDNQIIILSRKPKESIQRNLHYLVWDGSSIPDPGMKIDVVVNLAGAGIADRRWSKEWKNEILVSRLNASKACVSFIRQAIEKPSVFIAGAAIGIYGGDRPGDSVDEAASFGNDFMADVCKKWEEASKGAGIRTVILRTGVVLGKNDGPWPRLFMPYRFFVGGPLGSGRQGFPWMHVNDWVDAVLYCIHNEKVEGPVIMTAPDPGNVREFSKAISRVTGKPALFRVPKIILQLLLGEMSIVVWGGVKANPEKLKHSGFAWKYDTADKAVDALTRH